MMVLVDTPLWSLAFRKKKRTRDEEPLVDELKRLVLELEAVLIGPVRQETLSGINDPAAYERLRSRL